MAGMQNIREGLTGNLTKIIVIAIVITFVGSIGWAGFISQGNANVIATTVDENAALLKALFGCQSTAFKPSIPNLVYQYSVFTNFASDCLNARNPEIPLD